MISLKFIPLTFITSNDEIIRQIKNTVVFSHLFETCKETTFSNYIETTQYGFTASALENGSHRMLRITDIHHSKVNWESVPFCDCPDDEKYLLKDNDILVARTGGTTGKSFFVENPPSNAIFASYLIRIRLKKDVNIEFINAFLNSYCFWSQIVEMKGGSAQPNVNAEKLKVLVMPDCDLETQEKTVRLIKEEDSSNSIREKINSVENLFWNNNKISTELNHQLVLVKELRQAYLREAMQGKLVPQDSTDEPAEILLEKIKAEKEKLAAEKRIKRDKPLPPINTEEIPFEIPSNWTWCRLGAICEFSPRNKAEDDLEAGFIPMPLISQNFGHTPTFEIRDWKSIKSGFTHFANNDVVLAKITPCFENSKAGIVKNLPNGMGAGTTELYVMRGNEFVLPEFIYAFVKTQEFLKNGERNMRGVAGQKRVPSEYVYNSYFPLPPLTEQKRIVVKLEKLMKFCDELEANIRQGIKNADQLLQTALKEALEPK